MSLGDRRQVGFIKGLIRTYGSSEIMVGSYDVNSEKDHLGANNVKLFGSDVKWSPEEPDGAGHDVMVRVTLSSLQFQEFIDTLGHIFEKSSRRNDDYRRTAWESLQFVNTIPEG